MSSSRLFHKEEVTGKSVIESTGRMIGKVKDVMFSLDGGVILIVEKKDGTEMQVPLSNVVGLSEFVIIRSEGLPDARPLGISPRGEVGPVCKFCGHEMSPGNVYCPDCKKSQI